MRNLLLFSVFFFLTSIVYADQDCSKTLFNEKTEVRQDFQWRISYLAVMTEEEWGRRKQNLTLDALIYDVPVQANYKEVNAWAKKVSSTYLMQSNESVHTNIVLNKLSPSSVEIYKACVNGNPNPILMIWIESDSADFITIKGRWRPSQADLAFFDYFDIPVENGKLIGDKFTPATAQTFTFQVRRDSIDSRVAISVRAIMKPIGDNKATAYSDSVIIEPYVAWKTEQETNWINTEQDKKFFIEYKAIGGYLGGRYDFSIVPRSQGEGWKVDPKTISWFKGAKGEYEFIEQSQIVLNNNLTVPQYKIDGYMKFDHSEDNHGARHNNRALVHFQWLETRNILKANDKAITFF